MPSTLDIYQMFQIWFIYTNWQHCTAEQKFGRYKRILKVMR